MTRGVFYIATGEAYLEQAILSAKSVKNHSKTLSCALITDQKLFRNEDKTFDVISYCEKRGTDNLKTYDKILNLSNYPFDRTLYLDTDTFVLEDISNIFTLLDKYDTVFTFAHAKNIHRYEKGIIDESIPDSFPLLQGGFMLYKKCETVNIFFNRLKEIYENKAYFWDMPSIRQAVWETGLSHTILPSEYNFNDIEVIRSYHKIKDIGRISPKIFHYILNKDDNIPDLIRNQIA